MSKNPFGDDEPVSPRRVNPFGDEEPTQSPDKAATRIDQSARRVRSLRAQLGAEGMTPAAMRELIDELAAALEATARAIRALEKDG